ncbi:hypothetical protein P3S67_031667 [Capsicum chacoense]
MANDDEHSAHEDEDSVEVNESEEHVQKKMRQLKYPFGHICERLVEVRMEWKGQYAKVVRSHIRCIWTSMISHEKIGQLISREKLAEAIIEHDLPYSFVELKKIRAWADYVNSEIIMPSRNTAVVDVQKVYFKEKEKLKTSLG